MAILPHAFIQYYKDSFGAGIMGCLLAMTIYGVTTSQTYYYFVEYPKDKIWLKTLVSVLWILNTLHSALMFHLVYHYLILNAFDIFELTQNVWSLPASMIVHVGIIDPGSRSRINTIFQLIMVCMIMTYFLRVIFQCSKPKLRWWLTVPNGTVILVYIGFGIETVVNLFQTPTLVNLTAYTNISFLPLAATQAGADSMMAISLCFVLFNHRTGFRRTNSLLHTLMLYAVNRSLLTAGTAMVALLMLAIKPDSMIYIGPQFVISGLYTNALMATLNSRHRISTESGDSGVIDFNSVHLSNLSPKASELREGNLTRPILRQSKDSVDVDDLKRDVV
ncbi:hypothetical protein C8J57DRAFT_308203 [Mycena rebaudengoi]|nr:hypothetical protein C8J57DRAFT_308203 [Mycena rebaudengoi]